MSVRLIKSFAKKTGKPLTEIKCVWEKSKTEIAQTLERTDSSYYPELLIQFKHNLGLVEEYLFLDKFKELLKK